MPLYAIIFIKIINEEFNLLNYFIASILSVLISGVKENFVIIILSQIYLLIKIIREDSHLKNKTRYYASVCALIVSILCIVFIISAILVGTIKNGSDFYGNTINVGSRLAPIANFFISTYGLIVLSIFVIIKLTKSIYSVDVFKTKKIYFILVFIILSNIFFYNGYPSNSRYSFPWLFCFQFLCLFVLRDLNNLFPVNSRKIIITTISILIFPFFILNLNAIRDEVKNYTKASIEFSNNIEELIKVSKENPLSPVVITSNSPYDLEPIFAVNRFLYFNDVTNDMYLDAIIDDSLDNNHFLRQLKSTIYSIAKNGKLTNENSSGTLPSPFHVRFVPFKNGFGSHCIGVTFRNGSSPCNMKINFNY